MENREGVTLHFHVMHNDVGYMPNPDSVATYSAVDDAIQDIIDRIDEWIFESSQQPVDMPIRGQYRVSNPWTYGEEVKFMEGELKHLMEYRDNNDLSLEVATSGLQVPLETGISVLSIDPCSEAECEEHRDEWVT